jgi:hypothetical protein
MITVDFSDPQGIAIETISGLPGEVAKKAAAFVETMINDGLTCTVYVRSVDRSPCQHCGTDTPDDEHLGGKPKCAVCNGPKS